MTVAVVQRSWDRQFEMEEDPSYDIQVLGDDSQNEVDKDLLIRAVQLALQRHGHSRCCLSVALVGDQEIASLHQTYMNVSEATDVLTFDLRAEGEDAVDGEIIISLETALRESELRGHPVSAELALYAIHGTLHLLGYGDDLSDEAEHMHAKEDELLMELGVGPAFGAPEK